MCDSGRFSSCGARFCAVTGGRASVWDASRGDASAPLHSLTPEAHLAAPLACFTWLALSPQANQKWKSRKRKSSINGNVDNHEESAEDTHIAFGTSTGKILLYSLAQAKVETILEGRSSAKGEPKITSLDWNRKYGLYSCSADSTIREWNIMDNEVKSKFNMNKLYKNTQSSKTTAIKLMPDIKSNELSKRKLLLTAACQLRLWDLETQTILRTMTGHANDICYLDIVGFSDESKIYAISGSKNDRILSLWNISIDEDEFDNIIDDDSDVSRSKRKSLTKSSKKSNDKEVIQNAACNFLMEDIPRQASTKCSSEGLNTVKLCVVTRSGVVHYYEHTLNGLMTKPLKPITTVQIVTEEKDGAAEPVSINSSKLTNDSILVGYSLGMGMIFEKVTPNLADKLNVLIRMKKQTSKKEIVKQAAEMTTKIKRSDNDSSVVFLPSNLSHGDNEETLKRSISGKQVDVPMESRLANLSLAQPGSKQTTDSNNMAQLLVQALHSKDNKLLQTVFECKDPEVAYNSLNRLPIQYVSPLLDHILVMLAGKTNRCRSACVWAEALCKAKSSSLLALGSSASGKIKALRLALSARLPQLPHLLGLRARLVLSLHRSLESANVSIIQTPLLDYRDSSSDDEEMEMGDEMDDAILNNADDDSASWNEDDDDSKQSDQDMSENEDNVSHSE